MLRILYAAILLCCLQTLNAQNRFPADSLLRAADAAVSDTMRMKIYAQLADHYLDNNASKAIEYYEKARTIAAEHDRSLQVANFSYSIGYCYLLMANYNQSLLNYQRSVSIYEKLKDSFRLSNALMSIGNVHFQNKDRKKTNQYYKQAEQLALAMQDSLQLASVYDNRGIMYDQLHEYDSALLYGYKAYHIARMMNDTDFAMNSLSNIGLNYKHQFKTEQALNCFDTVQAWFIKSNAPVERMSMLYNNIGATQAQAGNYKKALEAFTKSIELARKTGSPTVEMENYRNMADMFDQMKDYKQASAYLRQYHHLKDSIFTLDNKNQLTELEAEYNLGKKNVEIVTQEAKIARQTSQRNASIAIAIATLLLLAGLAFFYLRIRKNNQLLTQKNLQINAQKNELQTLNHVKDRLFSIISHDLRNPLVTLRSYLSLADNDAVAPEKKMQFKVQTMQAVINTGDMLDNLLAWANVQIKNVKPAIVPTNIADCVWDTLQHTAAQAEQKQIDIRQHIVAATALADYDILSIALRNLLTNAIKYSEKGKTVFIESRVVDDKVHLSIRDEGIGLSPMQIDEILSNNSYSRAGTQGEKGSGLGLFLVQELLEKINASLHISSKPGEGSRFSIILMAV